MKALKILGGVVVVIILAIVVFLATFDVSQYKGLIQDQAKAATGRDVKIGDIKLAVSLSPAIVISDVSVANAPWGSKPEMFTAKSIAAGTQLIPLLQGDIRISDVTINGGTVLLEVSKDGKQNWVFDVPPSEASTTPLTISGLNVDGLVLAYKDANVGTDASVQLGPTVVALKGDVSALELTHLEFDGVKVEYKDKTQSAILKVGETALDAKGPVTAAGITALSIENADVTYKGDAGEVEGSFMALKVAGQGPVKSSDPIAALGITELSVGETAGAYKGKDAELSGSVKALKVAAKSVPEAKSPIAALGITAVNVGETAVNYKADGGPVDVKLNAFSIADDGAVDVAGTVSGQPISAKGTVAPVAELMALNKPVSAKLVLEALGLKIDADIVADVSKKTPSLSGSITIPELDLSKLMPPDPAEKTPAAKAAKPAPGAKVFPADPLPWELLSTADADAKLSIGKLTLPNGLTLDDVVLPVKLKGGRLDANGVGANLLGGRVAGDLTLVQSEKRLNLNGTAQGFTAEKLANELKVTDLVSQGPLDVAVDVRGSGDSVKAIMAGLNGSVIGGMGESRIRNDALNMIGADVIMQLLSAINPMGNKDPYTVARCAVINFQVTNGIANTDQGVALVTDKMDVVSTGKIDLAQEQVDLSIKPRATTGLSVGLGQLTQSFRIAGPLIDPGMKVDGKGAVKALGSIGAAFATGGASLLAQGAMDKVEAASGDVCATARTWHQKKK